MASQVYNIVTDRVLSLLEHGVVPWKRPWAGGEPPANLVSKKPYRGINPFLLASTGYASPYWLTFKHAQQRGGNVRTGEKATPVIFWKRWQTERTDPDTGESAKVSMPILRYYNVFNAEQCDGIDAPELTTAEFHPIERCESVVSEMPSPPTITHGEPRAWYRPLTDTVNMPRPELFVGPQEYYSTLFHELTHATGHVSRLGRPGIEDIQPFGSADYSREELVAEMGAAFVCGFCGIETATIENSAAYINGWLRKLRDDHKLVVVAAAQAQRAADCIRGITWQGGDK